VTESPREQSEADPAADAPRSPLARLSRRIYLTYRYHGIWSLIFRAFTFPLRFTPLERFVRFGRRPKSNRAVARAWYREHGRPVTVVIPSYRDAESVARLVKSIRRTTDKARVQIVVTDDASGPEHVAALHRISGVQVIESDENTGFASNVNRGIRAAPTGHDVVIMNSDMQALRGWLASLQFAASRNEQTGIVGPKLLYDNNRIQFGGTVRNRTAPEWFDHRYRFRPTDWGPANIASPVLAVCGACMYVKREVIERTGLLDESYPMAYEDVDYCLRAWQDGFRVVYWPDSELVHLESMTRGTLVGERERRSQAVFWERWGSFFDARDVRNADGMLRVVYVTEDTGVGGGHRDIFEHLNGLVDRGHEAELWTLGEQPAWFDLRAPVRSFESYDELVEALDPVEAIKIATWWNTAAPVWLASVRHGIPAYFVQDIETSYYPDDERQRDAVLASYREEFQYMTISAWNRSRLRALGLDAELIPPGIDLANFRPLDADARRDDMILALGRSNPLKNLPLTLDAWRSLPEPRPELCLFGIEPELGDVDPGIRYVTSPTDAEVNELFNQATLFVQTSTHEGFCLPVLEAMATGAAVVCTDAHGNRDFCADGRNCLMPEADRQAVADAMARLLAEPSLRAQLGSAGMQTTMQYAWSERLDALEAFLNRIATPRTISPSTDVVPQLRRTPAQ
jgi:GT2 family glycosyltransferase